MGFLERRKFLNPTNKGLLLGRYRLSEEDSFKNLCLIAPTGAGKTTRFLINALLTINGSAIVTDPSGEIFYKTSAHLKSRGFEVRVLQPANLSQSLRFNPLHRCKTQQDLRRIAETLANTTASSQSDPIWSKAATHILFIVLLALREVAKKDFSQLHLGNARLLLNRLGNMEDQAMKTFFSLHLDPIMRGEFEAFTMKDYRFVSSVIATATAALDLWSDRDIVTLTASDNVKLEDIREKPTIFYLIAPEHKIKYFGILLNLFYSSCFEVCLNQPGQPVYFLLEEFGNIGVINNFESISTTLRKRKCSISIVLQEKSQLSAIYGREKAQGIFAGGMANKLYLSGLDLETCIDLEKVLGYKTAFNTKTGADEDRANTIRKALMSSEDIRMLPEDKAIFISTNRKPILLKMLPYFSNPVLKQASDKKPYVLNYDYLQEIVSYLDLKQYGQPWVKPHKRHNIPTEMINRLGLCTHR